MQYFALTASLLIAVYCLDLCYAYSALEDARLIAEYKHESSERNRPTNHALMTRRLVHAASWSAVGTVSSDSNILGYPMVNIISIADSTVNGNSTGHIYFLLTDLDFTGSDWKHYNKVTFFFTADQSLNCTNNGVDPMEPTCPRAMISGQVQKLNKNDPEYAVAEAAYSSRHPRATTWLETHAFYFCKLKIKNIYVLDWYGGAHNVPVELYYSTNP